MSTAAASTVCATGPWRKLDEILQESFGADFSLWADLDGWTRLHPPCADDLLPPTPAALDTLGAISAPRVLWQDPTSLTLVIPFQLRRSVQAFAIAELPGGDSEQLERAAKLALKCFDQQQYIDRLSQENQGFLHQVTSDFEELTYLRSMAELLEISDLTFDLMAMAEKVLPTLKPLCDAEALVLLDAEPSGEEEGEVEVRGPRIWCGERTVDEATCTRLVSHFREACGVRPVVKNGFSSTPEGAEFEGVESFVLVPIVSTDMIIGWLLALNRTDEVNLPLDQLPWAMSYREFGTHEATLISSSAAILATHSRNVDLFREREELLVSVVRSLVSAIEAKDEYTRGHSERVALYARRLSEELGMNEAFCERIYLTGLLHDVGKIGVRDAVLRKPGPLSEQEFAEIKQHPDKGWDILHDLEALRYVLSGVLYHHEQVDGNGYPDQLLGDEIPLCARILAVVDAYDAMTSSRPYRPGMPHEKAEAILRNGAGTQWDAEIVEAFFRILGDILEIKRTYQQRSPARRAKGSVLPCQLRRTLATTAEK